MDFTKNTVLKENYSFVVAAADGQIAAAEHGLYNRDTRFLNRYSWRFANDMQTLLSYTPRPDRYASHIAHIEGPRQLIGVSRKLELGSTSLSDLLTIENTGLESQHVVMTLELSADFTDLFEVRGWHHIERKVKTEIGERDLVFRYRARDGLNLATRLQFSATPSRLNANEATFEFTLEAGKTLSLSVDISMENPLEVVAERIPYREWREGFDLPAMTEEHSAVINRAVDDLRALLLFTEHGPIPAAGIPWFVAAFGRDALLTALMMLPHAPEVAVGTLRTLAAHQGRAYDDFKAEAPGKIMHELRFGELTRIGAVPHSPYYGTVDAPPLFIVLLYETYKVTQDLQLLKDLKANVDAALNWMLTDGDPDEDGFLEFSGPPDSSSKGLAVQSWKDSGDSMSHADGRLAEGALAVSEVQGYAYAAYRAAAEICSLLGEEVPAGRWRERAAALKAEFHEAFWLEDAATYAMALDGDKRPLRVLNSDAGQLLWSGIVPHEIAPRLVGTLMSEQLWTGWGIRTLGRKEKRYNPVSYHNGSVWPHDTALIALGLKRYGFHAEATTLREAILNLAESQADLRPPELVAGYRRTEAPPVPYPVACRPQAWDAAALIAVLAIF